MNREERLEKWDKLIREGRYPSIINFNKITGISKEVARRTLEKDVQILKDRLVEQYPNIDKPLRFSKSRGGYYYIEKIAVFNMLTRKEVKSLIQLTDTLYGYEHVFTTTESKNILYKLQAIAREDEIRREKPQFFWQPVLLNKEGVRGGQEFFDRILYAIKELRSLRILYKGYNSKKGITHIIMPLVIKEWQGEWYLLAKSLKGWDGKSMIDIKINTLQVFALNRIVKIGEETLILKNNVKNLDSLEPETYFKSTFGVYRNALNYENNIPVIFNLIFETSDEWMYGYIKKTPIHSSLKIIDDSLESNFLRFKMELEWGPELESFILQFASKLKLCGSKQAVEKIKLRVKEILETYS